MSYLPEDNMIALKKNIKDQLILNKHVDTDELLNALGYSKDVFNRIINEKSNREVSPEMFQSIEIFAVSNNIDTKNFCGDLPETYGDRLKYFIYKHYLNQSEFSRRTYIPTSTIWNLLNGSIKISNKYKDKMCKVLTVEEFNLLSPYGDTTIPKTTDINIVNGVNLSWNMYRLVPKFFKYENLFRDLKINIKNYNKFIAGTVRITKPQIKIIANHFDCKESDLTEDSLELLNPKNRFGYWFATKLYNMNNSISMFADRCNLDPNYIADIIKGECLIKDNDIRKIANYLEVDPEGLLEICPKTDMDLLPIAENKLTLNEIVRARISNLGYTFKEFCSVMDVNHNTMATSLHNGRLPKKNREDIIRELDLQDKFPDEVKEEESVIEIMMEEAKPYIPEPFSPTKEMIENFGTDNIKVRTDKYGFAGYDINTDLQEETTTVDISTDDSITEIDMKSLEAMSHETLLVEEEAASSKVAIDLSVDDIENILSMMDNADYNQQISLAKFICKLTGTEFTDDISANGILGKLNRLNLIKDNL